MVVAWSSQAHANFWDIYGFNPRAIGMAGTHALVADDFTAVHHNPAGLTASKDVVYGFSIVATRANLGIDFDRNPDIAALEPPNATAISFGTKASLGGEALEGRIAAGLGLSVPTRSLLNGQALDPAVPHWYMYHALPERIVANLGIGVLPFDWLSLGVGVQFLAGLSGELDYELDIIAGRFSRKTVRFDIEPKAGPVLGLEFRPLKGLRVGGSYRKSVSAEVILPVHLVVTGIADLQVDTDFVVHYMPDQWTFGASYLLEDIGLLVSAEATLARWSRAPDPAVDSRIDVSGELFEQAGLGEALDAPAAGEERQVDLGFHNILIPRVGVEYTIDFLTLRAGYAIRPSPAPQQRSGTNYVDGTTHHIGAGFSIAYQDPWAVFASPIIADLGFQAAVVPSRRHDKISPDDPIGSYDASGAVFVLGFALRYRFTELGAQPAAQDPKPKTTTPTVQ